MSDGPSGSSSAGPSSAGLSSAQRAAVAEQSSLGATAAACLAERERELEQLRLDLSASRAQIVALEHLTAKRALKDAAADTQIGRGVAAQGQMEALSSAVRDLLRDSAVTTLLLEQIQSAETLLNRLERYARPSSGSAILTLLAILRHITSKLAPEVLESLPPKDAALIWQIRSLGSRHWLEDYVDRFTELAEALVAVRAAVADVEAGRAHDPAAVLGKVVALVKPAVRYAVGEKLVVRLRLAEAACNAVLDAGEALQRCDEPAARRAWECLLAWLGVAQRHPE